MRPVIPGLNVPTPVVVGFLLILLIASIAFAAGRHLLSVRTIGSPVQNSVRTTAGICTLIDTQERYIPSLHRQPSRERYRLDLVLDPMDGRAPRRRFPINRDRPVDSAHQHQHLLGADGDTVWLIAGEIIAVNVKTGKLTRARHLLERNPELGDLVGDGFYEFDNRLVVSSRDQQRTFEIDGATLRARAVPRRTKNGWMRRAPNPEELLCTGGRVTSNLWFGLASPQELRRDLKPGARLATDHPFEPSRERRKLHLARLDASEAKPTIVSVAELSPEEWLDAALVRESRGGPPLRLSNPDSVLVGFKSHPPFQGTLVLLRVDLDGRALWRTDTGLADLDQFLPDPQVLAIRGRRPRIPDRLQEPLLLTVDLATGTTNARSLWIPNP